MLTGEGYLVITEKRRQGMYLKDIAVDLKMHPWTVSQDLRRGGEPPTRPKRRVCKLDSFREQVDDLLRKGIWNVEVVYGRLRAIGYTGGRTIQRMYIPPKRALRPDRTVR